MDLRLFRFDGFECFVSFDLEMKMNAQRWELLLESFGGLGNELWWSREEFDEDVSTDRGDNKFWNFNKLFMARNREN